MIEKPDLQRPPPSGMPACGMLFPFRDRRQLVADLFTVGRNWLSEDANDPFFCDMAQIQALPSDRQDFDRIKALITQAQRRGGWLVFGGHDIGTQDSQFTTRIPMLEELFRYV
jgi:hypothetical protein